MTRTGWGPPLRGGRPRRALRRSGLVVGWGALALALAIAGVGVVALRTVDRNLTRVDVSTLDQQVSGAPLNLLIVGSDSREGLTQEQRGELVLGDANDDIGGQRSDTVLLVSVLPDGQNVSVVSFPRDLPVVQDGVRRKLTEAFFEGPDALVDVVQQNFGIPVHHYVEVSVLGFISTVEVLGSVEICLDEPLRDPKSGADFDAGCQEMSPAQALTFVRSRRGARGDFNRIERQQAFLRAMVSEMAGTDLLLDVPKLLNVVEQVARNVRTDQGLGVRKMQSLAEQLRVVASGDVPMTVVPSYVQSIDGKSFVVPYRPGAEALFDAIEAGEVLASRGRPEDREAVELVVWSGGRPSGADLVQSTLFWTGFDPRSGGRGAIDAEDTTTVFHLPGQETEAGWVAATLGAPLRPLPTDIPVDPGTQVIVAVGDDAAE